MEIQKINDLSTLSNWQPKPSLSVALLLKNARVGIAKCRKIDAQTTIEKVILILIRMTTRLNIDRNMTAEQVRYCAEDIVNSDDQLIYNLTLDELNLCMEKGVKGEYGEIYNRMDQAIVFKWVGNYIEEKLQVGERIRNVDDGDMRQNIHEVFQTETMHTILTDVVSKLSIKEVKEPDKPRVVTPDQELVNSWMDDFQHLFEKQGSPNGAVKYVQIGREDSDIVSLSEYLDYRLKEYNENK